MTVLQEILGHDPETGEHEKAYMLRRLAQLAVMEDREISQSDVARKVGLSRQAANLYFQGRLFTGRNKGNRETPEAIEYREAREDEVERAIEAISAERGIVMQPAIDYVPEVLTRELMKAPA